MANNKIPQPLAGDSNPNQHNDVNLNELKTLFCNPNADIPIFMGITLRTQLWPYSCLTESKLLKHHTNGQTQQQLEISNLP